MPRPRGQEKTTLATLAMLVACFGVVLGCAIGAGELLSGAESGNGSTGVDQTITSWAVTNRAHGLTIMAKTLSTLGSQVVLLPAAAVVVVFLVVRRRYVLAGLLTAAWGGAIELYSLTKHVVQRPRRPSDLWLTNVGRSTAFPSGHATQSLATYTALVLTATAFLARARRPGLVLALALAAGVGWSRVYLGVHWATDVIAGWLIAAAWVVLVSKLAARIRIG